MQITLNLRITGEFLQPEDITNLLGVTPQSFRRKGEVHVSSSQKEIVSKFGFWFWKSANVSGMTIGEHIEQLKATFGHNYDLFAHLPNAENVWIDICIVKAEDEEKSCVEFILDTKSLLALGETSLPVEFAIY